MSERQVELTVGESVRIGDIDIDSAGGNVAYAILQEIDGGVSEIREEPAGQAR